MVGLGDRSLMGWRERLGRAGPWAMDRSWDLRAAGATGGFAASVMTGSDNLHAKILGGWRRQRGQGRAAKRSLQESRRGEGKASEVRSRGWI